MKSIVTAIACSAMIAVMACAPQADGSRPNIVGDARTMAARPAANLSPEQKKLQSAKADYARSRVQGAAAGAALGALACALLAGGSGANRMQAAAACGVAGGVAGYAGATYLTRDHSKFTASAEALQADIASAKSDNQSLAQNVKAAEDVLAFQRKQIAELNAGVKAGTVTRDQYQAKLATANDDVAAVKDISARGTERLASLDTSIGEYRKAGIDPAELVSQRSVQKASLDRLRTIESSLVASLGAATVPAKS